MANEKLVSSIYFRGGKVSSSELDVIDTSLPATYEISIINNDGHVIPDALDIQVGLTTAVLARQVPKRNDVPKFWYGLTGAAASKFDLYTGGGGKQPLLGEVSVPTNALVIFSLQVNHYPSLVDLDATLDLYHDAARTQKFASIPIRNKAVTGVSLRLTTMRNLSNQPEVEPLGIYNNDVLVVYYTDPNINRSNYVIIPFKTKINGVDVPAGFYPPGGASWLVDQWYNDVRGYGTSGEFSVIASRQKNPTVSGNVPIEVTMGDLVVTNTLVDSIVADLKQDNIVFALNAPLAVVTGPFPAGVSDKRSNTLSFGYAFVKQVPVFPADQDPANYMHTNYGPATNYITNLIINRNNPESLLVQPKGSEIKSLNNAQGPETFGTSVGTLTYLAWDRTLLTSASKRRQFGKYQKTLSVISKWNVTDGVRTYRPILTDLNTIAGQPNLTLDLVQDPIATAQYGALTSLSFSTLAAFVFSSRDISIADNQYDSTGCVSFGGQRTASATVIAGDFVSGATLPPEQPSNPQDHQFRTDFLFIRNNGQSEINTFTDDVPYPRFINVQTVRGYEAFKFTPNYGTFWDFYLDPGLGINLMDSRYSFITTVQNDSDWGYEFYVKQQVDLVGRSPNHLKFRSGFPTTQPSMSLAIIDKGPA